MSSDPHLDVSKTPNTFYESAYKASGGVNIFGITVPGKAALPLVMKSLLFTL